MKNLSHNKKSIFSRKRDGFLMVEVLVAAFVLTFGLVATTALITSSLRNSFDNRDAIIAVGLAQEGVELVRNVRDNGFAQEGNGFANFPISANKHCLRDYTEILTSLSGNCLSSVGDLSRYYLQYQSNFYSHQSVSKELFSRYIYIDTDTSVEGQENALVRSFVYWGNGGESDFSPTDDGSTAACTMVRKCVFTEIKLTNWQ